MNKKITLSLGALALTAILVFACKKKTDTSITPTYKSEATGTGANPNVNNQTVTGTNTLTNPATANSGVNTSNNANGVWTYPNCASTNSLILKANNGSCDITVSFAVPPTIGTSTYAVASTPIGNTAVSVVVNNAINQPSGVVWYGRSGSLAVTTTSNGISAQMSNIVCTQKDFNFPTVSINGPISCN